MGKSTKIRRQRALPKTMVGLAWVGVWNEDGKLGWAMPNHIDGRSVEGPLKAPWVHGTFWRCTVTIELALDKKGRAYRRQITP